MVSNHGDVDPKEHPRGGGIRIDLSKDVPSRADHERIRDMYPDPSCARLIVCLVWELNHTDYSRVVVVGEDGMRVIDELNREVGEKSDPSSMEADIFFEYVYIPGLDPSYCLELEPVLPGASAPPESKSISARMCLSPSPSSPPVIFEISDDLANEISRYRSSSKRDPHLFTNSLGKYFSDRPYFYKHVNLQLRKQSRGRSKICTKFLRELFHGCQKKRGLVEKDMPVTESVVRGVMSRASESRLPLPDDLVACDERGVVIREACRPTDTPQTLSRRAFVRAGLRPGPGPARVEGPRPETFSSRSRRSVVFVLRRSTGRLTCHWVWRKSPKFDAGPPSPSRCITVEVGSSREVFPLGFGTPSYAKSLALVTAERMSGGAECTVTARISKEGFTEWSKTFSIEPSKEPRTKAEIRVAGVVYSFDGRHAPEVVSWDERPVLCGVSSTEMTGFVYQARHLEDMGMVVLEDAQPCPSDNRYWPTPGYKTFDDDPRKFVDKWNSFVGVYDKKSGEMRDRMTPK